MRMFAGANGSGKSTLKEVLPSALLGVYVNPDDMEKSMRAQGMLDFSAYQVHTDAGAVLSFLRESPLLRKAGLLEQIGGLRFADNKLVFGCVSINSYWASVLSDLAQVAGKPHQFHFRNGAPASPAARGRRLPQCPVPARSLPRRRSTDRAPR